MTSNNRLKLAARGRSVALERWGHRGLERIGGRSSHSRYLEAVKEVSSDAGGGLAPRVL